MVQPQGYVDPHKPTHVCKLVKALYGLKQAPKAWYDKLKAFLVSLAFKTRFDSSLFFIKVQGKLILVLVYVDDILITGDCNQFISELIVKLNHKFSLKDLGVVSYFLGLETHRTSGGIQLTQPKYIKDLLQKVGLSHSKPVPTPICSSTKLSLHDSTPLEDITLFRSTLGALQYLTMTRPDISFVVNKLSQFLNASIVNHWKICKRVLRYLKGTITTGIMFQPITRMSLECYADADWASCVDDRRSTSGFSVFLGPNIISWSSKKQHVVARSSTESEYRALALATTEVIWIRALFVELGITLAQPSVLWTDNIGAITLASNPVYHARTKHIEIDVHFIRDQVRNREIDVRHVPSEEQLADILTKPLSATRFQCLCNKLCLASLPQSTLHGAC
ncbi:hypothetical protein DH2020_036190 [Rehmannia glutinosa]|uniref:Reverse transcriptase Ty1/copia-type domain-containing protein n=1 Tax=Rehmannia glutinosa TaxID=99300 RepID=A0ABR0V5D0_REHGL